MRPVLTPVPSPQPQPVTDFEHAVEGDAFPVTGPRFSASLTEVPESACRYWISVPGRDGWPSLMPIWGLWLDEAIVFAVDSRSIEISDPEACSASIVQFQTPATASIVDGTLEFTDDPIILARYAEACEAKYGFDMEATTPTTSVYVLWPHDPDEVVHADSEI
jgi:hypothetical protein